MICSELIFLCVAAITVSLSMAKQNPGAAIFTRGPNGGRHKKAAIVALARKLLVALWKYVAAGVVIEGAIMKAA
jgi:hypothetical protein